MRPGRQELKRFRNAVTVVTLVTVALLCLLRGKGYMPAGHALLSEVEHRNVTVTNVTTITARRAVTVVTLVTVYPDLQLIAKTKASSSSRICRPRRPRASSPPQLGPGRPVGRDFVCKRVIHVDVAGAKSVRL